MVVFTNLLIFSLPTARAQVLMHKSCGLLTPSPVQVALTSAVSDLIIYYVIVRLNCVHKFTFHTASFHYTAEPSNISNMNTDTKRQTEALNVKFSDLFF